MPAPVPIRVRYGPSGELLAQAAFAAGRGARQQREDDINRELMEAKRARDAATLRAMLDYNAQIRSDQQEAVPLYRRTAADEAAIYGQPVQPVDTSAQTVTRASAGLPQEPTELERWQNFRQVQNQQVRLAELDRYARENPEVRKDPNWQRLLTQIAAGEDVDESVFQQIGIADTPAVRAKRAYLESLAPQLGLSDTEIQALKAAAADHDMSMASFRQAVNDAERRAKARQGGEQLSPQRQIELAVREVEQERRSIEERMEDLRKALEGAGYSPYMGGEQFLVEPVDQGWFRRTLPGNVILGPRDQPRVDQTALQQYQQYQQLRARRAELTQQRTQLIQGTARPAPVGEQYEQNGDVDEDPLGIL